MAALKSGDLVEVELVIESKNDYESLVFEDMKAAGFEPVMVRSGYTGNEMGAYVEFRDQKVAFFVRRLARRLVGDEHRADDLVQDVWATALVRPPRHRASLRGWLSRVARNLASNAARAEKNRRLRESRAATPPSSVSIEEAEREFELQRTVAEAVHALDEPFRTTILLRYFKELPRARIAGSPEGV